MAHLGTAVAHQADARSKDAQRFTPYRSALRDEPVKHALSEESSDTLLVQQSPGLAKFVERSAREAKRRGLDELDREIAEAAATLEAEASETDARCAETDSPGSDPT